MNKLFYSKHICICWCVRMCTYVYIYASMCVCVSSLHTLARGYTLLTLEQRFSHLSPSPPPLYITFNLWHFPIEYCCFLSIQDCVICCMLWKNINDYYCLIINAAYTCESLYSYLKGANVCYRMRLWNIWLIVKVCVLNLRMRML